MAWTTPRTWTTGEVPTAAIFNTHVRDNETELRKVYSPMIVYGTTQALPPAWPDAVSSTVYLFGIIGSDWDGGTVSFKLFRRSSVATNTAVMTRSAYRFRNAAAFSTIDSAVAMNYTPGNTNTQLLTVNYGAANFAAGDVLRVDVTRDGANGSDTMAGSVDYDGAWIEYN